jgi:hypothetical protein
LHRHTDGHIGVAIFAETRSGYRLKLYFVTTAKLFSWIDERGGGSGRKAQGSAFLEVYDGKGVLLVLSDYLDGVAPPVASLDLPLEVGHGVINECHRRHDARNGITAWIFSMNEAAVSEMYDNAGSFRLPLICFPPGHKIIFVGWQVLDGKSNPASKAKFPPRGCSPTMWMGRSESSLK